MSLDGNIVECLGAIYRFDLAGDAYVRHVAEAAAPILDRGFGVLTYTYDASDPAHPAIEHFATSSGFDAEWLEPFYGAVQASGYPGSPHPTGYESWSHMVCGQASAVPGMRRFLPLFAHIGGSRDAFALNAVDASGKGLWIGAPLPTRRKEPPRRVHLFTRFAAHLGAAMRLRRLAEQTQPKAAAVLAPGGALLDAAGDGVVDARELLRRAAVGFDEARTQKLRKNDELATRKWRPLVASRWSLLDEFDSDGRRFVVAVENALPTRPARTDLSEREHQVMTQAHLGHTDKVIAYELGLSASTVRVLLHRAARKLGAPTRKEALARFDALVKARQGGEARGRSVVEG